VKTIHFPIFNVGLEKKFPYEGPIRKFLKYHEHLINYKKIYHNSLKAKKFRSKIKFDLYRIYDPKYYTIRDKISENDGQQQIKKILNNRKYISGLLLRYQKNHELTFKNVSDNKIIFFDCDPSFYEDKKAKLPKNFYDTSQDVFNNPELVAWVLKQNNYKKIFFIHGSISPITYYKKYLSKKDAKNLISFNFGDYKNFKNLNPYSFQTFVKKICKNSLVIFNFYEDEVHNEFKLLLNHLNKLKKEIFVLELSSSLTEPPPFGFLRSSSDLYFHSIKQIDQNNHLKNQKGYNDFVDTTTQKNILQQIDLASLIFYIAINKNIDLSKTDALSQIKNQLELINGKNEIFVGNLNTYCFDRNNRRNYLESNLVTYYKNNRRNSEICVPFFKQSIKVDGNTSVISVHYTLIDIIKIDELNVSEGLWNCEFIFEVISTHNNPIEIISFTNLHNRNQLYEKKLLSTYPSEYGYKTYVYKINANFSFEPNNYYFPFDKQNLFIEYKFNESKFGILHSVPESMLDPTIDIDGWSYETAYSGQKRHKKFITKDIALNDEVEVERNSRFGIILKRIDNVLLLKTIIPLIILLFVNYYCVFISRENIIDNIILQVTIFLTGIALFFATDKPQPLKFTLIDLFFSFFYLMTGSNIIFTMTQDLLYDYSNIIRITLAFSYPVLFVIFIIFILLQIKRSDVDLGIKS